MTSNLGFGLAWLATAAVPALVICQATSVPFALGGLAGLVVCLRMAAINGVRMRRQRRQPIY